MNHDRQVCGRVPYEPDEYLLRVPVNRSVYGANDAGRVWFDLEHLRRRAGPDDYLGLRTMPHDTENHVLRVTQRRIARHSVMISALLTR